MNKKKLSNELSKVALEIERTYLISKEDDVKEGTAFSSYPSTYHYGKEEEEDNEAGETLEEQYKKLHDRMKGKPEEEGEPKDEEEEEDLAAKTEKVEQKIKSLEQRVGKTAKDDSDIMAIATELRNMADKLEAGYRTTLQGSRFN